MRLYRIQIRNFRNFRDVTCRLGKHVVLLGENGAGKSNFLYALRLLLDPALPDSDRYLDEEDFWDGVPAFAGSEIIVSVDLTEYEDEPGVLACLADHEIDRPAGHAHSVARLTYRFGPRETIEEASLPSTTKDDYVFAIYGRDDPSNSLSHEVRHFLGFRVLNALRDAEGDLRAWKRSPLRPLLESVRDKLDGKALANVAKEVDHATAAITAEKPLAQLRSEIAARLSQMLGQQHELVPTFGFNTTDPRQLLQSLRLFMDKKRSRQVSDTSLGLANVLYLSLLILHTEQQESLHVTATTILGIEEPEAHLHPQMQRVVFRDLLRSKRSVLVSTHSPNIASVAPIDSLVILRTVGNESQIASFADAADFTEEQRADLERYLDVTRAEIVFGRGIILVEGDAERFVVPAAARLLPVPVSLDEFGITICSVAGTDFVPYAKLLRTLGIPFVIVTDGDKRDAAAVCPGIERGRRILESLGDKKAIADAKTANADVDKVRAILAQAGVFVGARTLETDLLAKGAGPRLRGAFESLFPGARDATLARFGDGGVVTDSQEDAVIALAERAGKGRFAQCFAARMVANDVPLYIRGAIEAIVTKCRRV